MIRMKGRYEKVFIITIFLIILEIVFTNTCYATDLISIDKQEYLKIVDKNGKGDYTSIQDAINNEPEGSIIHIKSGFYNEILTINKNIYLLGEDKENTIIQSESLQNKYSICLNAPGIVIEKLSIKNTGPGLYTSGIKITAPDIQIIDCTIYETPVGIAVFTSNNTINCCEFYRCSDEGIVLLGTSYSDCKNNKITNCIFYENCDGIELQYSSDNLITNCEFYNNTHNGIDAITSSNDRNIISSCNIYNNNVHGVYLSSSSYNKIIDCNIQNNDNGNIIMNKDSINNQIITNSNLDSENYFEGFMYYLLSKKFGGTKIISLFKDHFITFF